MRRFLAVASAVLLSLPVLIGWPGTASAAEVEIDSPAEVLVGEETTVIVTIVDSDGAPVVGGEVALRKGGRTVIGLGDLLPGLFFRPAQCVEYLTHYISSSGLSWVTSAIIVFLWWWG